MRYTDSEDIVCVKDFIYTFKKCSKTSYSLIWLYNHVLYDHKLTNLIFEWYHGDVKEKKIALRKFTRTLRKKYNDV